MGITIFAQGKLDRIEALPKLLKDLQSIAREFGWQCRVIDDDFCVQPNAALFHSEGSGSAARIEGVLGLKGIVMNIGFGSESLAILFDQTGVLTDMLQQLAWIQNDNQGERFTACKTQFGNIDSHIQIIALLDRLKNEYIADLAVDDEGGYWESHDRRALAEKRIFLGKCIRQTEKAISSIQLNDGDSRDPEALVKRIEKAILLSADDEEARIELLRKPVDRDDNLA